MHCCWDIVFLRCRSVSAVPHPRSRRWLTADQRHQVVELWGVRWQQRQQAEHPPARKVRRHNFAVRLAFRMGPRLIDRSAQQKHSTQTEAAAASTRRILKGDVDASVHLIHGHHASARAHQPEPVFSGATPITGHACDFSDVMCEGVWEKLDGVGSMAVA